MEKSQTDSSQQPEQQGTPEAVKKDIKGFWVNFRKFLSELLDIRQGTDRENTIEGIKKDISFKGHTAWILIFSIFIASIGLNIDSTAVVIGAMLISPLMGPILGVGLSIGIHDIDTLKRSLINFGIMVFLSVLTSFLYFKLSLVTEVSKELLARTQPTLFDVFIGVFGGLAGIVAGSRKEKSNVIPGVAIATALMPPLCTAGYGLAMAGIQVTPDMTGWQAFGNAFYLFTINSIFIALSTYTVVKLLKFPVVKYVNSIRRRRIAQAVSIVSLLVMIPSVFLFLNMVQDSVFKEQARKFVSDYIAYEGTEVIKFEVNSKTKTINLYLIGELVPEKSIATWNAKMKQNESLKEAVLSVNQGADRSSKIAGELTDRVKSGILEELYINNREQIKTKDERIRFLERELSRIKTPAIAFESISKEAKINYKDLTLLGYSNFIKTDFSKTDTLPVFTVQWADGVSDENKTAQQQRLHEWLKVRIKADTIRLLEIP